MRPEPRERPIIFNAEMVRAVLAGRKTQTRRPLKRQPENGWEHGTAGVGNRVALGAISSPHPKKGKFGAFIRREWAKGKFEHDVIVSPFGQPGDRLWVRETFRVGTGNDCACYESCGRCVVGKPMYAADFGTERSEWGPWKPSIHMPRWASRIILEITDIRVERVQDISEEDAIAEGLITKVGRGDIPVYQLPEWGENPSLRHQNHDQAYRSIWTGIYGHDAWDRNDWVWVIEFKRVDAEQQPKAVNS